MANLAGFNAATVDPMVAFEPIPAGDYLAEIVDSEMKSNKAGTGEYLNLTFEVLDGDCKGRRLWARLNLDNPHPTAVKLAQAELSAICRAVGVMSPRDSVDLHHLPLVVTVKLKKRSDTGELDNEIKNYAAKSSRLSPSATGLASVNGAAAPWSRG
jgi:hypothetical protein